MSTNSQTIEQLQERYQAFNDQRIKIETQREHALEQLEDLKAKALGQYGSDDVQQLKQMLEKMKTDNEAKRKQYQESLDSIDKQLAEIDGQFSQAID